MAAKHFIGNDRTIVQDCLQGLTYVNKILEYDAENKIVYNKVHDGNKKVTLISGGGAGHEPSFAGYVGPGMLSAAVSGFIFASPSTKQVENAILRHGGSAGTLLIIMNYTGDVLNFHLAAEKARIAGHNTAVLVVGDDVSVGRKRSGRVGRRGLAGTILVLKILGAMAQEGFKLQELVAAGERLVDGLATVGVALDHVHVPGRTNLGAGLGPNQAELGIGIHNEPGCRRLDPQPSVIGIVDQMLAQLTDQNDPDRAYVTFDGSDSDLVLLVNNLGGLSQLEFGAIVKVVANRLKDQGLNPCCIYAGPFMTSLDSKGFSITLLKSRPDFRRQLDAPVSVLCWAVPVHEAIASSQVQSRTAIQPAIPVEKGSTATLRVDGAKFIAAVSRACAKVIASEDELNGYDSVVGDGDCGSTLGRVCSAIMGYIQNSKSAFEDAIQGVQEIAQLVEDNMDGTSGALYAIFFNALVTSLQQVAASTKEDVLVSPQIWSQASSEALKVLERATPARVGDRTLMDAIIPFVNSLATHNGDTVAAIQVARDGRNATVGLRPAFGRAVYVPETAWGQVPDPGAAGVVRLLEGLLELQ